MKMKLTNGQKRLLKAAIGSGRLTLRDVEAEYSSKRDGTNALKRLIKGGYIKSSSEGQWWVLAEDMKDSYLFKYIEMGVEL